MSPPSDEPTPPDGLPDDMAEKLRELSDEELRKTIIHAQELLVSEGEGPPEIEPRPGEDIIKVAEHEGYTEVVKRVPCGEDCDECPHGPYLYHVREETLPNGETDLHWEFLGRTYPDDA
jgi:hypothetical protein